jgi:hypothetical protein
MRKRQLAAIVPQLHNWKTVMELGRRALAHHGLQDWSCEVGPINAKGVYTRRRHCPDELDGYCSFTEKRIYLDWQILNSDERYILEVLHHEIAHALAGPRRPPHGPRWQQQARTLGVPEENIQHSVAWDGR